MMDEFPTLSDNEILLGDLALAMHEAEQYFNDVYNWAIYTEEKRPDIQEPDVLSVFGGYGKAFHILIFLKVNLSKKETVLCLYERI